MKILEIANNLIRRRLLEEEGTFVGLRLSPQTVTNLQKWMRENDINQPVPPEEMHVTLVLSRDKKFDWFEHTYDKPLKIQPDSFSLELFGEDKNVLVLKFECDELRRKHMAAREEFGIEWNFDDYCPHVTLSHDVEKQCDDLEPPKFPLVLINEYTEPFVD